MRECESYDWSSYKYIRLDVPKDCIKLLNKNNLGISGDETWGFYNLSYNNENSRNQFIKIIDSIYSIDKKTDEENINSSKINSVTRDAVILMLKNLGVPTSKYEYPSSRSKKRDWIPCVWSSEIFHAFKTYSSSLESSKIKLIETFDKIYKLNEDKKKAEEKKKQDEISRKESERELAFLLSKYNLSITDDWNDLQRAIISKNKYLYLAHYLRLNRGDWNDGYSYAETGLSRFDVETPTDKEIYYEISNIVETYEDIDGRYFRDCEWNYDALFSLAKEQDNELFDDYQKTIEKVEQY